MASDDKGFWFPFYSDQYLGGTMGFTLAMHGAYLLLLIYQEKHGFFSEEEGATIAGEEWPRVKAKFEQDPDGGFYNVKMRTVLEGRRAYLDSRRRNAQARYSAVRTGAVHMQSTCSAHALHRICRSKDLHEEKKKIQEQKKEGEEEEEPCISSAHAEHVQSICTAHADPEVDARLRRAAESVASGAYDAAIQRMRVGAA